MQEVSIEIEIFNRKYPLRIQSSEAEAVEKAATLINSKIKEFELNYGVKDVQDLFAMTSLHLVTQMVNSENHSNSFIEQVNSSFCKLEDLLDEVLINKV
jgi:cell division protein ZapA